MRFTPIPTDDVPRRLSRALGHPIRVEALSCLIKEDTTSANRIAKQIGQNTGTVAYHVRVLFEECQVIELADVQPVRGALEHFFRLAPIAIDSANGSGPAPLDPEAGADGLFMSDSEEEPIPTIVGLTAFRSPATAAEKRGGES